MVWQPCGSSWGVVLILTIKLVRYNSRLGGEQEKQNHLLCKMTKNHGKEEILVLEKPKSKKNSTKRKVKKRVKKEISKISLLSRANTYLHALLDPFTVHGVQVPDFACYPSATFSVTYRNTLTVGTGGCCGLVFGRSFSGTYPNLTPYGGLVPYNTGNIASAYCVGAIFAQNMDASTLIVNNPLNIQLGNFDTATAAIPANFSRVRLVSMGTRITYIGNALQAQGKITTAFAPLGTLDNKLANSSIALADLLKLPHSTVTSVPLVGSAQVTWRPVDFNDQNYCQVGPAAPVVTPGSVSEGSAGCEMYVFVDGAVNTQTFFVEAVFNYEAIPTNNTVSFVECNVSRADPISLAHAANTVELVPQTMSLPEFKTETEAKKETIMEAHTPRKDPTLMDTILDYAPKVAGTAKKVFDTMSPLVGAILAAI